MCTLSASICQIEQLSLYLRLGVKQKIIFFCTLCCTLNKGKGIKKILLQPYLGKLGKAKGVDFTDSLEELWLLFKTTVLQLFKRVLITSTFSKTRVVASVLAALFAGRPLGAVNS